MTWMSWATMILVQAVFMAAWLVARRRVGGLVRKSHQQDVDLMREVRLREDYQEAYARALAERDLARHKLAEKRLEVKALKAQARRAEKALPVRAIKVRE
jgi:ribosome-binding protein aMBF1 (putative translation factor)